MSRSPGAVQSGARVLVRNPAARVAGVAVVLVFAAAALGGILDPTDAADRADWWPGAVFVAVPVALAARGSRVGIVVTGTDVVLRGWIRTRRVPRDDVHAVKLKRYSGLWNRHSRSRVFRMLALKTSAGTIDIPAVAARRAKAERLAAELRHALSITAEADPGTPG